MSLLPVLMAIVDRRSLITVILSSILFSLSTNSAFAQALPPSPQPCANALTTDKLTKVVMEPQEQKFTRTGAPGTPVTIQHTFSIQVDFSKLSAIFAQPNSDYLEAKFQDLSHRESNILSLNSSEFNSYHGPGQKAAPRVMVDQLKQKYVQYISAQPEAAESANLYSDINGQNPKNIYQLITEFSEPNPASLGGDEETWNSTWGQYWEKIPTAVSEFYYGQFAYFRIEGDKSLQELEEQRICPEPIRRIYFILPDYFRTASIANQLNQLIVPVAAQSADSDFVDRNLVAKAQNESRNFLAKAFETCINALKNTNVATNLRKIIKITLDLLPHVKDVYAKYEVNPIDIFKQIDQCPRPIEPLRNDKEGTGPFCSVPEIIGNSFNLNENECVNVASPFKLDNGTNVKCIFVSDYSRTRPIATGKNENWDSCTPTNDGTGQYTCKVTVRFYPVFYIPWLAPIWNNTTYSDENDKEAIFGSGKTGKSQETGRPGIYTVFTPRSVDSYVFPNEKNLPSDDPDGGNEIRQRFLGAIDDNKVFARDRALKPCALQRFLGIGCQTNL